MNFAKIVKILPMLDSPVDAEALSALRILQRALLPETCGDIARLIEAAGLSPEPEAAPKKPFNGFAQAKARVQPARPSGEGWFWDVGAWKWVQRIKPMKPLGNGWVWAEQAWEWRQVMAPPRTRYETPIWNQGLSRWEVKIDYPKVMAAAMESMNHKLSRNDKKLVEEIFIEAMAEKHISHFSLQRLENIERTVNV